MASGRIPFLSVLSVLLLVVSAATSIAVAADVVIVVTAAGHPVFDELTAGAVEVLHEATVVTLGTATSLDDVKNRLRHTDGAVIVGRPPTDTVLQDVAPTTPLVVCAYDNEEAEGCTSGSNRFVVLASTPLADYARLFRQALPGRTKVAVLHKKAGIASAETVGAGLIVRRFHIPAWDQLKRVMTEALRWGDLIWLPTDPELTDAALVFIIKQSLILRKPLFSSSPRLIRGGAVGGLVRDPREVGRVAARWLSAAGRNTSEPTLPVARLTVNVGVAGFLGVEFPEMYNGCPRLDVGK